MAYQGNRQGVDRSRIHSRLCPRPRRHVPASRRPSQRDKGDCRAVDQGRGEYWGLGARVEGYNAIIYRA